MNNLKVACIGAGYFSHFHFDAWSRIPGVEIAALCDLNIQKAEKAASEYHIPAVFDDVQKMLDQVQPDFVDIITPPNTHTTLVQLSVDRGIPVICQKPLAPTLEEATELVTYAKDRGVPFIVHENWRFQPWYRKISAMIRGGELGELFSLHTRMRMGDGWKADAYLARQPYFRTMERLLIYETGIHFIDTYRYLAGEVESVYARLSRRNPEIKGEDAGIIHFNFVQGASGVFDGNRYNESVYEDSRYTFGDFAIDGSKGTLRLDGDGNITFQPLGKRPHAVEYKHERKGFAGDCVFHAQQHFLHSIKGLEICETSGESYLKNLKVQEAVYTSSHLNQLVSLD